MNTASSGPRKGEPRVKIEGQLAIARRFGWSSTTTLKKYMELYGEDFPVRTIGSGAKPRYWAWADEIETWIEAHSTQPVADRDGAEARGAATPQGPQVASALAPPTVRTMVAAGLGAALSLGALIAIIVLALPRFAPVQSARVIETGEIEVRHRGLPWTRRIRGPWGPVGRDALNPAKPAVLLLDADHGGQKKIVYDHRPRRLDSEPGRLYLLEAWGEERWSFSYERRWPGDERISGLFSNARLRAVRRPFGVQILAVAAHFGYYPSRVVLLASNDGTLLNEYLHPGALQEPLVLDNDSDGFDDLVLLPGQNNPFEGNGHATLAVLPIPFASRRGEVPNVLGADNTKELAYLVFPNPLSAWLDGEGAHLRNVAVTDAAVSVELHVSQQEGPVAVNRQAASYLLDRAAWSVRSVSLTDWYRRDLRRRVRSGELPSEVLEQEGARLRSILVLETAPDGNSRLFPTPEVLGIADSERAPTS